MRLISLIFVGVLLGGCVSLIPAQPLRYDGVYKEHSGSQVIYRKFEKDEHIYHTVVYSQDDDQKAIEELEQLSHDTNKKASATGYSNDTKEVRIYGTRGNMHFDGSIKKNERGELKNNYFLRIENTKVKEIIDLRIVDSYKIFTKKGDLLTDEIYEELKEVSDKYIIVKQHDKYGVFDVDNKQLILPCIYQWIENHSRINETRAFKKDNKFGFFDEKFNVMIANQYDEIYNNQEALIISKYFTDDVQAVKLDGNWMFVNKEGKPLTDFRIDGVEEYISKKFIPIYDDSKHYFEIYDLETQKFINIQAYHSYTRSNYTALNIGKGKELLFDQNGKLVFKDMFDFILPLKVNDKVFFEVRNDNKYGLLDENGNNIIPLEYQSVSLISTDDSKKIYIKVKNIAGRGLDFTYELFDLQGNKILPSKYLDISVFDSIKEHFLTTSYTDKRAREYSILMRGESTPLFKADYIWEIHEGEKYTIFRKNGLYGIIDKNLKIILEPQYKHMIVKNNFFAVYNDQKSKIYKIDNDRIEYITEIDGLADFRKKYIISNNGKWRDVYDYTLNKVNKLQIYSSQFVDCYDDTIVFQNKDNNWEFINNGELEEIQGDFERVTCYHNILIGKLKNVPTGTSK